MRVQTILNFVERQPRFVYAGARLVRTGPKAGLHVTLRPKRGCRPLCGNCGRARPGYDRLDARTYRYLPLLATVAVFFLYRPRRCACPSCGVTVERVPWATGKSPITHTLGWWFASWAKVLPWQEVARRFHVSWDVVFNAVGMAVQWGLKNRNLAGIRAIGVDELSRKKGQTYFTMVYQIDHGARRLLWLGQDRTAATFHRFFDQLGDDVASVRFIASDMWKAFLSTARKRAPRAVHVLDRFHVAKLAGEAVDEVRRDECHDAPEGWGCHAPEAHALAAPQEPKGVGSSYCRVPVSLVINPSPAVFQDTIALCESPAGSNGAIFDLTTVDGPVSGFAAGVTVQYYGDQGLFYLLPTPTNDTSASSVVYSKVTNLAGCSATDSVILQVHPQPEFPALYVTGNACAPASIDVATLIDPFATVPPGTDTLYFSDAACTIPHPNPHNVTVSDTVYIVLATNTIPVCADTAIALIELSTAGALIANQDILNYSIPGFVGCNTFTLTDGNTDTLYNPADCKRIVHITDVANGTSLGW